MRKLFHIIFPLFEVNSPNCCNYNSTIPFITLQFQLWIKMDTDLSIVLSPLPSSSHSILPKIGYCVQWGNRDKEIFSTFKNFLTAGLMTDMILSCATGDKTIRCHKLVLAAASNYFEEMLRNSEKHVVGQTHQNFNSSSFVVIKDVGFQDLEAVVTFIYEGKVMLEENRIPGFLQAAESLKIKGIVPLKDKRLEQEMGDQEIGVDTGSRTMNNDQLQVENYGETSEKGANLFMDQLTAVTVQRIENFGDISSLVTAAAPTRIAVGSNSESLETPIPSGRLKRGRNKHENLPRAENEGKMRTVQNNSSKKYKLYSKKSLLQALACMDLQGMNCNKAAKLHGVPYRTLYQMKQKATPMSISSSPSSSPNDSVAGFPALRLKTRLSTGMSSQTTESCDVSDQSDVDGDDAPTCITTNHLSKANKSIAKRHKSKYV